MEILSRALLVISTIGIIFWVKYNTKKQIEKELKDFKESDSTDIEGSNIDENW